MLSRSFEALVGFVQQCTGYNASQTGVAHGLRGEGTFFIRIPTPLPDQAFVTLAFQRLPSGSLRISLPDCGQIISPPSSLDSRSARATQSAAATTLFRVLLAIYQWFATEVSLDPIRDFEHLSDIPVPRPRRTSAFSRLPRTEHAREIASLRMYIWSNFFVVADALRARSRDDPLSRDEEAVDRKAADEAPYQGPPVVLARSLFRRIASLRAAHVYADQARAGSEAISLAAATAGDASKSKALSLSFLEAVSRYRKSLVGVSPSEAPPPQPAVPHVLALCKASHKVGHSLLPWPVTGMTDAKTAHTDIRNAAAAKLCLVAELAFCHAVGLDTAEASELVTRPVATPRSSELAHAYRQARNARSRHRNRQKSTSVTPAQSPSQVSVTTLGAAPHGGSSPANRASPAAPHGFDPSPSVSQPRPDPVLDPAALYDGPSAFSVPPPPQAEPSISPAFFGVHSSLYAPSAATPNTRTLHASDSNSPAMSREPAPSVAPTSLFPTHPVTPPADASAVERLLGSSEQRSAPREDASASAVERLLGSSEQRSAPREDASASAVERLLGSSEQRSAPREDASASAVERLLGSSEQRSAPREDASASAVERLLGSSEQRSAPREDASAREPSVRGVTPVRVGYEQSSYLYPRSPEPISPWNAFSDRASVSQEPQAVPLRYTSHRDAASVLARSLSGLGDDFCDALEQILPSWSRARAPSRVSMLVRALCLTAIRVAADSLALVCAPELASGSTGKKWSLLQVLFAEAVPGVAAQPPETLGGQVEVCDLEVLFINICDEKYVRSLPALPSQTNSPLALIGAPPRLAQSHVLAIYDHLGVEPSLSAGGQLAAHLFRVALGMVIAIALKSSHGTRRPQEILRATTHELLSRQGKSPERQPEDLPIATIVDVLAESLVPSPQDTSV